MRMRTILPAPECTGRLVGVADPVNRKLPAVAPSSTALRTRSNDSDIRCHSSIKIGLFPVTSLDESAWAIDNSSASSSR